MRNGKGRVSCSAKTGEDLFSIRSLVLSGLVAAAYAVVTVLLAPVSYGPLQFRVSEALTVLPFFLPQSVPGLFLGCLVANLWGGFGVLDVVFGSAATLLAAVMTSRMPNIWLAALPPVLVNALLVGGYLSFLLKIPFWTCALYIGTGQAAVCFFLGIPLAFFIRRRMEKGGGDPSALQ